MFYKKLIVIGLVAAMILPTTTCFASKIRNDENFNFKTLVVDDKTIQVKDIKEILKQADAFEKNTRRKSADSMNEFIDKKILELSSKTRIYPDEIANNVLNPQELALYNENKYVGLKVALAAKAAGSEARSRYKSAYIFRDNGDAFRHAYWNALMARDVGYSWAQRWGNAHEYGEQNNDGLDKTMDLYNNRVGRNCNDGSNNTNLAAII